MSPLPPPSGGGELGEIPYLRPHPGAALFEARAARFAALAAGHSLGEFLEFCGRLAAAQAAAATSLDVPEGAGERPAGRPLDPAAGPGDGWLGALSAIAGELEDAPMPAAARDGLGRVAGLKRPELAALARALLSFDFAGLDLAAAPFAAAALQVEFAVRAARIPPASVARSQRGCPLCGSPPVAAVVLGDDKLRYLACALCGSQWHLTRITCSHCGSNAGISYLALEGDPGGVKAETCDGCRRYLKVLYLEHRPASEPEADDTATLALDELVAEQGYARAGVNLLLLP
ncbi:MAG TPA: formate dehydrogenase accessory protein FdhE [Thermoanaerobaculaceae bacterium]|nr:formate dehydrogenase accessory protein FdhE [Thermoanaerobaculaceae bacterium]